MSTVLKGITAAIIYTPLALLILTILFIIEYGVKYYRENGDFPDAYKRAFSLVKYLVMTIIVFPIKCFAIIVVYCSDNVPEQEKNGIFKIWIVQATIIYSLFYYLLLYL